VVEQGGLPADLLSDQRTDDLDTCWRCGGSGLCAAESSVVHPDWTRGHNDVSILVDLDDGCTGLVHPPERRQSYEACVA
jgi:hypothetical protein